MPITAHFAAGADRWPDWQEPLRAAFAEAGLDVTLTDSAPDPAAVDYIIYAPGSPLQDFSPFTNCKAVLNIWAGVERIVGNPTLRVPLCRMVDPSLSEGMVEYVTGHVLRYHLGIDDHLVGQDGVWRHDQVPPLARERPVAMLGLGALGQACARALLGLGFPVLGWSRTPRDVAGVDCRAGADGLQETLARAQIVVTLLPQTPETQDIIDASALAMLPRGAYLINPGRGPLIDDDALIAALDTGQLAHATLDVFREEPLPPEHPFWPHPRITVTPHIAAETRPRTAARVIAENIRRGEAGAPLLHQVDTGRGY